MFCAIFSYDKISCSQGSLSHFLFTEKSTIKDWEIVLIAAATIVFFLLVAIGVLAVSIQIISLHFCDAYLIIKTTNHARIEFGVLGNRYTCTPCFNCIHLIGWSKFLVTICKLNRNQMIESFSVIYTGEVRERRKAFERKVVGKNVNFQFVSWARKFLLSQWVGCRKMMAYGVAPTYFYHVND